MRTVTVRVAPGVSDSVAASGIVCVHGAPGEVCQRMLAATCVCACGGKGRVLGGARVLQVLPHHCLAAGFSEGRQPEMSHQNHQRMMPVAVGHPGPSVTWRQHSMHGKLCLQLHAHRVEGVLSTPHHLAGVAPATLAGPWQSCSTLAGFWGKVH